MVVEFLTAFTPSPTCKHSQTETQTSHCLRPHPHTIRRRRTCMHGAISKIETASLSVAGMDPDSPGKVNQDVAFHSDASSSSTRFVYGGVLDGHGKKGHVLNEFLGSCLPQLLHEKLKAYENEINGDEEEEETSTASIDQILIETFEEAHLAARMDESVPAGRSGTTCVVSVVDLQSGMVYTGNVGDSRAILAFTQNKDEDDDDDDDGSIEGKWNVISLSIETTTKRDDERARIEENEGRIDSGGNVW